MLAPASAIASAMPATLVRAEIIHHDDIARSERRCEELLDIGVKPLTGHWSIKDERGDETSGAKPRHKRRGMPVPVRRGIDQAFPAWMPAVVPHHVSLISASVMPLRVAVSSRSRSSWPASRGLRWPPILPGSVLPVSRTRRSNLIAADALTAHRAAACRAELPCSTAPTSRCRRSWDNGAAITASSLLNRHSQNQNQNRP